MVKAEMDKSLLEAAGIPAFIAGENSASIGYGTVLAEIHLQVQDADVDRARQVLQDNNEATPLSDDFIPPAVPSLPDDSIPKAASQEQDLETEDSDTTRMVWSAITASLVVVAIFTAFAWWKNSHNATAYYRSGYVKWTKRNLDGAMADFDTAIELNSRYAYAYNGRGLVKWAKGDLDSAITDYNMSIALDPKDVGAYVNRGIAEGTKGDLKSALADYDNAVELDPKDARVYYNRSSAKRSMNDLDGALADLDKAIELDPKYILAYEGRGLIKRMQGDLDGSLADYDKALELNPRNVRAFSGRAFTKRTQGDLDGAISDYNQAIELDPKDAGSYDGRSFVKRVKGDLDGAISDYDRAIELNPKDAHAYYGRGVAHYDKRNWSAALSDFRNASALKPTAPKSQTVPDYSRFGIWMTRSNLGERNAATDELKEYLLTRTIGKPGDWPSTIARFLTGEVSESDFLKAADSDDVKQMRNQKCEAYFYAGNLRLLDGDKSTAADYFKKCLETGAKDYYEYQSATAELEALKQ